jgi:hypothetical protein
MNKNSMLISRHAWLQSNTKERLTITDTNEIKTVQRNKDSTKTITSNFKNPFKLLQSSKIYQNVNPKESHKSQDFTFPRKIS